MPYKKILLLFFSCSYLVANAGCKKSNKTIIAPAPSNLVINSVISTDGSGKVNFTATADNTISFIFNFGNGSSVTAANGIAESIYKNIGTNTYNVTVTAEGNSGLTISKTIAVTVNYIPKLVWSDEFDKDGLPDSTKWGYDLGASGWGNNELEYYTNRIENAAVSNGTLKINMIKENYKGSPYTSARMLTKGKYEFKYGKVEVRAKLPTGVGTWPAIWMLGANVATADWPACGEIDIMEHLGRDLNNIYSTLHYPGRSGGNADGATRKITNATDFHIYTLEWSPTVIKMFADGELIHSVNNSNSLPFNHTFFIILNVAMGGNFGGAADPSVTGATMEVDYVRVYQ